MDTDQRRQVVTVFAYVVTVAVNMLAVLLRLNPAHSVRRGLEPAALRR